MSMATKIYTVMKDGEELDKLKTLAAAKKLADAEGAEVYSDGKCVYQGTVETVEGTVTEDAEPVEVPVVEETKPVEAPVAEEPVDEKKPDTPAQYRLKALMNVRANPNGRILKTLPAGTVVQVASIDNDWLHLTDGTFILFGHGEYAEKA
jgi:hypothetical protein